jgi:hypothetical protein
VLARSPIRYLCNLLSEPFMQNLLAVGVVLVMPMAFASLCAFSILFSCAHPYSVVSYKKIRIIGGYISVMFVAPVSDYPVCLLSSFPFPFHG